VQGKGQLESLSIDDKPTPDVQPKNGYDYYFIIFGRLESMSRTIFREHIIIDEREKVQGKGPLMCP
jgi:hypothetical protein